MRDTKQVTKSLTCIRRLKVDHDLKKNLSEVYIPNKAMNSMRQGQQKVSSSSRVVD